MLTLGLDVCIIPFVETILAHRQAVRQRTLTPSSKVRILVGQLENLEENVLRGYFFVKTSKIKGFLGKARELLHFSLDLVSRKLFCILLEIPEKI